MEISERMEHVESMKVHCTGSTHVVTADTTSWKKDTGSDASKMMVNDTHNKQFNQ